MRVLIRLVRDAGGYTSDMDSRHPETPVEWHAVYRAPMRSRSDAVDHAAAVAWALAHGVVAVGRQPGDAASEADVERVRAREDRFCDVADGAFMWTWEIDQGPRLGRVAGPCRTADDDRAAALDLAVLRPCTWIDGPLDPREVPPAVLATFERGGRNFQRVRSPAVEAQTLGTWRARWA